MRMSTRAVRVGGLSIGGDNPIAIQSMLSVPAHDVTGNVEQAVALQALGCEIIRFAIPNAAALSLIEPIKAAVSCPLVADIHFDYRLALGAAERGIDKIRINPGNIGGPQAVRAVAECCLARGIPIRIGVNSGSVERELLAKYGGPTPGAMVESAKNHAALLEQHGFYDIVLSLKSSDVKTMLDAYRLAAMAFDYPLHLGVTEAGTPRIGLLKSAIGIGSLLADGIGDTIRVSLTADPLDEIAAAKDILRASGRAQNTVNIISCPTCGRTKIDLISLAAQVEAAVGGIHKPLTIAVMGCAVNGPGEARGADLGIAAGDGEGILFAKGEIVKKVPEDELLPALLELVEKHVGGSGS